MKKLLLTTVLMVLTLSAVAENKYRQYTVGLPFNMPEVKAPEIPASRVDLKDFALYECL